MCLALGMGSTMLHCVITLFIYHVIVMAISPCVLPPRIHDIEGKYYADGEDAYEMRKYFGPVPAALAKKAAALTAQVGYPLLIHGFKRRGRMVAGNRGQVMRCRRRWQRRRRR